MSLVVVAGSQNDRRFAIIDFSVPASPVNVLVTAPFLGGCMVDCSGTQAAVGNFNGGEVSIYDISNPAAPVLQDSLNTALSGIGAISFDGSRVLVGEVNGFRLVLIDVSNPSAPSILSTFTTSVSSISAISLKGAYAVAGGPNDLFFVVVDYTTPSSPTQVKFVPGTDGVHFGNSLTCDLDGTHAAFADYGSGNVYLFDIAGGSPSLLGQYASDQAGVSSISISGNFVAAASTNDFTMSLIDFTNPASPSGADTATSLGGGATVKLSAGNVAAGAINGFDVTLFATAGTGATAQGTDDTTLGSLFTLGMTRFTPVTPEPKITVSPASVAFGAVRVGTTSAAQTVTLKNTGTAPLDVAALQASASQYHASPFGNLASIAPGHSTAVQVTFTPAAVQSYPAALTMTTNDPAHPSVSVPLSGSGGYPHAVVPGPLGFGDVAVCLSHTLGATIGNTGPVSLNLSSIAGTSVGFSASPASLTVPPGGNAAIQVTFKPATTGALSGSLGFHTDDPAMPDASVALSGTGTPEPPPAISVSPSAIDFGAVPLQYFAGIAVTVANTGPCEDLDVTLTVTGAAFVLTTGDPTTLPPSNPPIIDTVGASTSKNYTVVFAPTATGGSSGTLTIVSNDPAHPSVTVALTGTGVTVSPAAIELVLDRSGSMATTVTGGTRMTALQSAVNMFAELVIPGTGFAMGTVQFDTTEAGTDAAGEFRREPAGRRHRGRQLAVATLPHVHRWRPATRPKQPHGVVRAAQGGDRVHRRIREHAANDRHRRTRRDQRRYRGLRGRAGRSRLSVGHGAQSARGEFEREVFPDHRPARAAQAVRGGAGGRVPAEYGRRPGARPATGRAGHGSGQHHELRVAHQLRAAVGRPGDADPVLGARARRHHVRQWIGREQPAGALRPASGLPLPPDRPAAGTQSHHRAAAARPVADADRPRVR